MKLVCFTYAGGNKSFFNQLKEELNGVIDVVALEYAGHGTRNKEPLYSDFDQLAQDMYVLLKQSVGTEEYALLGYSMGSISLVEVLKLILQDKIMSPPKHLFLGAHEPYTKSELTDYDKDENDELVKQRTIQFGGIPEKLQNNRSFWRMYLPIYKADYSIIGKYKFEELNLKTEIPATILYSETDTPLESILAWKNYFVATCEFLEYTGTHFFINDHYKEIAEEIKVRLVNK